MKQNLIEKAYEIAKERYAAIGVDTDKALDTLQKVQLSLHLSLIHISEPTRLID